MSIALLVTDRDLSVLRRGITKKLPGIKVQAWPDITTPEQVEFAVVWQQAKNSWAQMPNIKVISSLGAGCDFIFSDPQLPQDVKVTRIVDPGLAEQMAEYVLGALLMLKCQFVTYIRQQQQNNWQVQQKIHQQQKVTILGVGKIGDVVANRLMNNGFNVTGWSRTKKEGRGYPVFFGKTQLAQAVTGADYVISILPNTPATQNLIDKTFLALLTVNCYLINVGRGQVINERDLLDALDKKVLQGAVLDVFNSEPLVKSHEYWQHKSVVLTPHISAITDQQVIIDQIVDNYNNFKSGLSLNNEVDASKGY